VTLVHAKDVPAAVRREHMALEDFVKGVEVAFGAMNSERRSRFLRNVDMIGEAGKGSSIRQDAMLLCDLRARDLLARGVLLMIRPTT
jgi:hypothetical protein